tara:strand:+ start:486 stop:1535 length:1050 start_codon:yes stop_codon:yes gene_type:complete
MTFYDKLVESKYIPLFVYRIAIRFLLGSLLRKKKKEFQNNGDSHTSMIKFLSEGSIAVETDSANNQHYEVKPDFYKFVLGKYLKYSSGFWDEGTASLDDAEKSMLELTVERAQIKDGQSILDLGSGWGSLSLFLAKKFPNSEIIAVSNSQSQVDYINSEAERLSYTHLSAQKHDINTLAFDRTFDRIISIEMFEHLSNYKMLFEKISSWLSTDGYLMTHIFGHKKYCYPYSIENNKNWIAKHFFTGGIMPNEKIFSYFQTQLLLLKQWRINGIHYHKTCEQWIKRHYLSKNEIVSLFEEYYGKGNGVRKWHAWKIFFLSCSEIFRFKKGSEWMVFHYLFKKKNLVDKFN